MSWLVTLVILSFSFSNHLSEARTTTEKKNLRSAFIVGTVYCDTCLQKQFSKTSHFISGASVIVECDAINSKPSFSTQVQTDKDGKFKVHLPFSVEKHVKKIQGCSVKLIRSSDPYCSVASSTASSPLHLKSRSGRTYIFSAGEFTFKPLTQTKLCNTKPSLQNLKDLYSVKFHHDFPQSFQDPQMPLFPPVDNQGQFAPIPKLPSLPPLSQLRPLPSFPNLPFLPPTNPSPIDPSEGSAETISDQKTFGLPPNPFHPPVIFNPFQPPPAIIPPLIPSPSTSVIVPPLLRASPPPPTFSLIPPFPFQPSLGFPGTPPPAFPSISNNISP